jgi:FkbM family methyltransferase
VLADLRQEYTLKGVGAKVRLRWRVARRSSVVISGVSIRLGPHISPRILRAMSVGRYERAEVRMVSDRLSAEDIVMDVGTGLGVVATLCAQRIGAERVHTYEANPELERPIRETFLLNDVYPRLEMCLLGRTAGEGEFHVSRDFWSSSTVPGRGRSRTIRVPRRSINDELARVRPSFLIVDIEGGEYELFDGIDLSGIRKLALELHERVIGPAKTEVVKRRLMSAGFRVSTALSEYEQMFFERD